MNLDCKWLDVIKHLDPKIFVESREDKYFREKLNRLSTRDYAELMRRYIFRAAKEGTVSLNEFDRDIDLLLLNERD